MAGWKTNDMLFQLTTSRGGRHLNDHQLNNQTDISTHDLTRRSTAATSLSVNGYIFQLTTSRGGRRGHIFKK